MICGGRGRVSVCRVQYRSGDNRCRAGRPHPSRPSRSAGLTAEVSPPRTCIPALSPLPRARRLRPRAVTALAGQEGVPTRGSSSPGRGAGGWSAWPSTAGSPGLFREKEALQTTLPPRRGHFVAVLTSGPTLLVERVRVLSAPGSADI